MPKETYRVELTKGISMHTFYEGRSRDRAAEIANVARATLIVGKGTSELTLRVNGVADVVWSVKDGAAFLALIDGVNEAKRQIGVSA